MVLKATFIEDINCFSIQLPIGTYLIDGEVYNQTNYGDKIKFKDTIQEVKTIKYILEYSLGDKIVSYSDWQDMKYNLAQECFQIVDDEIEYYSIEHEFKYRKFLDTWKPIYSTRQEISEPLLYEVIKVKIETGNPYISSLFSNATSGDLTLYEYSRPFALMNIIRKTFDSLGMVFQDNMSYEQTKYSKIWSNSKHSNFEYIVAFGKYIFTKSEWIKYTVKRHHDLQFLLDLYESDKKEINDYITEQYSIYFGKFDVQNFNYQEHLSKLQHTRNSILSLDVKQSAIISKRAIENSLSDIIKDFKILFKV